MVSALRFVKLRIIGVRRTCSTVLLRLPRLPRVASKIPSSNRTDGFADSIENSPARKANETMSFRGVVEKSPALETARYVSAPAKCPRRLCAVVISRKGTRIVECAYVAKNLIRTTKKQTKPRRARIIRILAGRGSLPKP